MNTKDLFNSISNFCTKHNMVLTTNFFGNAMLHSVKIEQKNPYNKIDIPFKTKATGKHLKTCLIVVHNDLLKKFT